MMRCSLLLVDDEPEVPDAMRRALCHEGYDILVADSAAAALTLLQSHPVDVIISDHDMPVVSGAQLLGRVRDDYPRIVRIMLSGPQDLQSVMEAVNSGAVDKFLPKPWSNDTLRAMLREAAALATTHDEAQVETSPHATLCHHIFKLPGPARLIVLEVRNSSVNRLMSRASSKKGTNTEPLGVAPRPSTCAGARVSRSTTPGIRS